MDNIIQIKLPPGVQIKAFEVLMLLAASLYERGHLSSGQAADLAGLSKRAFVELLGHYEVSVFGYGFEELEGDLGHV